MSPATVSHRSPRNLPYHLTRFIGREIALAELRRLLHERRLVTLTGAGGSGKTRLALEAAATLEGDFPDGIVFVELAPVARPELVVEAAVRALGVEMAPGRPALAILTDVLRAREALLVLDNCEHLLDACAHLAAELLASCPALRVLATSREPLGVGGECIFNVPPLSLPDASEAVDPAGLAASEAVQLFMDRARLANRDFALTKKTGEAVARICTSLDGIPLALELAAAALHTLAIAELAARLDQRFRLLTAGNRTALPRHQTLRALLDWSHALLDARQQIVFRRLAVFPAAWSAEAAEAVCTDDDRAPDAGLSIAAEEMLDIVMQLVNKSLTQFDHASGRYRLLETIRLYALDELQASGEEERVARRHFAYYRTLAERGVAHLGGPDQQEWFVRLEREQANLRAALGWAIASGCAEEAALLALAVWPFWVARGYHHEARRWLEQIVALDTDSQGSLLPAPLRARLLGALGVLAHTMNDFAQASRYHQAALRIWRAHEDPAGIATALLDIGWQHFQAMDLEAACRYAEESLMIARRTGVSAAVGAALILFGNAAVGLGRLDDGVRALDESLNIWRCLGNLPEVASVLIGLARAEQLHGNEERAGRLTREALHLQVSLGDYNGLIGCLVVMVFREFDAGRPPHRPGQRTDEPLGYLSGGTLPHGPVAAARLLGVMAAWQEKIAGRHTVQWDRFVAPLCAKLGAEMGAASFTREFAIGKAMSVPDFVALAEVILGPSSAPQAAVARATTAIPSDGAAPAGLTPREIEVLRLVAAGLTNAQAAERLSITPRTVNAHLTSIYTKTGVSSRTGAVRFAVEHGLT